MKINVYLAVRILFAAASTVVIIAGLKSAQSILIPFLFALLLAMLGSWPHALA